MDNKLVVPKMQTVSIVIPTYGRGRILLETTKRLLQQGGFLELILVDQTPAHEPFVREALSNLSAKENIKWIRRPVPSIVKAMNEGLRRAGGELVLFLDDDIVPGPALAERHAAAYTEFPEVWAVCGQVLQPGERPRRVAYETACDNRLFADLDFPFYSTQRAFVRNVMAGNLSVRRKKSLEIGGFDANYIGTAFRFETDFCRRLWRAGGKVLFEPSAGIYHLRAPAGGIRRFGHMHRSASSVFAVSDYYFAFRHGNRRETVFYILDRIRKYVGTRFHATHPWWIPVKLFGESAAFIQALKMIRNGPQYISNNSSYLCKNR